MKNECRRSVGGLRRKEQRDLQNTTREGSPQSRMHRTNEEAQSKAVSPLAVLQKIGCSVWEARNRGSVSWGSPTVLGGDQRRPVTGCCGNAPPQPAPQRHVLNRTAYIILRTVGGCTSTISDASFFELFCSLSILDGDTRHVLCMHGAIYAG